MHNPLPITDPFLNIRGSTARASSSQCNVGSDMVNSTMPEPASNNAATKWLGLDEFIGLENLLSTENDMAGDEAGMSMNFNFSFDYDFDNNFES